MTWKWSGILFLRWYLRRAFKLYAHPSPGGHSRGRRVTIFQSSFLKTCVKGGAHKNENGGDFVEKSSSRLFHDKTHIAPLPSESELSDICPRAVCYLACYAVTRILKTLGNPLMTAAGVCLLFPLTQRKTKTPHASRGRKAPLRGPTS